jgi:hypothetical protein
MNHRRFLVIATASLGFVMGASTVVGVHVAIKMERIGIHASNTGQGAPNLIWLWITLFISLIVFVGSLVGLLLVMDRLSSVPETHGHI